jgi:hypothetical protein
METQTTVRNWNDELKKSESASNFLKMKANVPYSITIVDEGTDSTKDFQERKVTQVNFNVKVTGDGMVGQPCVWSVTREVGGKAVGPDSLWRKLAKIAVANGERLMGMTIDIRCEGEGRDRKYLVKQFSDLMFAQQAFNQPQTAAPFRQQPAFIR